MNYAPGSLLDTEKKIEEALQSVLTLTKCKKLADVKESALVTPQITKNGLASTVESLVVVLDLSRNVLRSAAAKMEEIQSEQITSQKSVIQLQEELIKLREDEIDNVQKTVKTEIKSFANIVENDNKNTVTKEIIKRAVKSAVSENQRDRNVAIFGLQETTGEDLKETVKRVVHQCSAGSSNNTVVECYRLGRAKTETCRPVKVSFQSPESAISVLAGAKSLKQTVELKGVFVSPDRTPEERAERKRLVVVLKKKIQYESGKYHFIRNGKLQCSEKRLVSQSPSVTQSDVPKPDNFSDFTLGLEAVCKKHRTG